MYDEIANAYHLVYEDWNAAVLRQAAALDVFFRRQGLSAPLSILDVACGIGTQSLGLAALGHAVTASDLSAGAVARAQREAGARGLGIAFRVGDMRTCDALHGSGFDILICLDNALPHLLDEASIDVALRAFLGCLRPGGLLLVGLRDYRPDEDRSSPQVWSYGFRSDATGRHYVFQTRDWDGEHYDVAMYFVREGRGGTAASVVAGSSRYYAIPVARVMQRVADAGFADVVRLDDLTYQPTVVARRP